MSQDHVCCGCHEKETWDSGFSAGVASIKRAAESSFYVAKLEAMLYRAIVELEFVQSVENCTSGLCATAEGKDIVSTSMSLLDVPDLSMEWGEYARNRTEAADYFEE